MTRKRAPRAFRTVKVNGKANGQVNGQKQHFEPTPLMLAAAIERLMSHISECQLQIEFILRNIRMQRAKPQSLILPGVKPEVEVLTLGALFEQQREAFAELLLKEIQDAKSAQAKPAGNGAAPVAPPEPADQHTDAGVIIPGKFTES